MAKRSSPTDKDFERIAETIINTDDYGKIQDKDSFDIEYDDYFEHNGEFFERDRFRDKVYDKVKEQLRTYEGSVFTDAGGKDLKRDRQQTAKRIVNTRKQYIKEGASKVDLKGYDTQIDPQPKKPKRVVDKSQYNKPVKYKGKVIYGRETTHLLYGKTITRVRNAKGQFIK